MFHLVLALRLGKARLTVDFVQFLHVRPAVPAADALEQVHRLRVVQLAFPVA